MPLPHVKSKISPPQDVIRGLMAENAVSSILNLLTLEREEMYVFHAVEEENPVGETDHILLYKRKLILIETKNRANIDSLTFSNKGELLGIRRGKDATKIKVNSNNLLKKVERYSELYPSLEVQGVIVTHHDTQKLESEIEGFHLTRISDLIPYILGEADKVQKNSIDVLPVIKDIAVRCIRNELIN